MATVKDSFDLSEKLLKNNPLKNMFSNSYEEYFKDIAGINFAEISRDDMQSLELAEPPYIKLLIAQNSLLKEQLDEQKSINEKSQQQLNEQKSINTKAEQQLTGQKRINAQLEKSAKSSKLIAVISISLTVANFIYTVFTNPSIVNLIKSHLL